MACTDTAVRPRIAILADDLTGAADSAAPFADRGLAVSVLLSDAIPAGVDVPAVVTDSRWRSEAEATDRVRAAVARLRESRPERLFIKVDSTLRGRIRADVSVALDAWGAGNAVATPAFPAQGRTVRDGSLLLHGAPHVPRVADHFPAGVRVADATSHEDLLRIAREIVDVAAVAVGSGGLARALAEVLLEPPSRRCDRPVRAGGVLLVVGTPHPVTRAQAAALLDAGATSVVLGRSRCPVATALSALEQGRRVLLTRRFDGDIAPDSTAAVTLAEELAGTVRAVVEQAPSVGLVLTGGATALAVATALGATELRLRSEVAEGLPLGELAIGDRRIPVVTKSGGFGGPESLHRAAEALEERT